MPVEIGQPAPDFTLTSHTGAAVSLSQFRGVKPVVLVFYPAGKVMDKKGRSWVAVPSMLIMGAALLLTPFTQGAATLLLAPAPCRCYLDVHVPFQESQLPDEP